MTALRAIATIGLCLFLAATSVTLAVARGAPGPVGVIVICTGKSTERVAVDASGHPVATPHVCPECLPTFHATAPRDPLPAPRDACLSARAPFSHACHAAALARPAMLARAPPLPVRVFT